MILQKILDYKRKKVEEERLAVSLKEIMKGIENIPPARDFHHALQKRQSINIIAEVKKASPSKGMIKQDFNPIGIANQYEKNKVAAISVLTEDKFFLGNNNDLTNIRKRTTVPLLRKDFIIDPYQIYQSKALGADAILLIAAALKKRELMEFQRVATDIGLYCLVEVHNKEELEKVLETGAGIIGINNRNLRNFQTALSTTEELISMIPQDKVIVSESGINTRRDMEILTKVGVNAVLVGESLMRSDSIEKKLKELRGGGCA